MVKEHFESEIQKPRMEKNSIKGEEKKKRKKM